MRRNGDQGYDPIDAVGLLRSYSRHRDYVRVALGRVIHALTERSIEHDASKMLDDEFAGFSRINRVARVNKFGTPEYEESMEQEREVIDLHFSRNRHHPERPSILGLASEVERGSPDGFTYWSASDAAAMSFLDVIEMVCDWWGARMGYDDPRPWSDSVALNLEKKGKYLSAEQLWLANQVAVFLGSQNGAAR